MSKFTSMVYGFILLLPAFVIAQPAGYSDSFDGEIKVSAPPSFSFEQHDGVLHIKIDKEPKRWQGVYYSIGETIDITSFPCLNLTFKTTTPFLLTAYIVDIYNNNMTKNVQIFESDTYVTYTIDFSAFAAAGVDASQVTGLIFTPNGNTHDGLIADVYMDELRLGTDAVKLAGVGAVPTLKYFTGSIDNTLNLLNIGHASSVRVYDAKKSLEHVHVTDIKNGKSTITFDCLSTFIGNDTLVVTVVGTGGYDDNILFIPFEVEGNYPPEIDPISNQEVRVGDTLSVRLAGIHDGNTTIEQPVILSATSSDQEVLPDSNITVTYQRGETTGLLSYSPLAPSTNLNVTVRLNDQFAVNNLATTAFSVNVYQDFNESPTINPVPNQFTYLSQGEKTIVLVGLYDGDDGSQNLDFTMSSSNESVIPASNIDIDFEQGQSTAKLTYTPIDFGTTTITLDLQDDGGTASNNGNATASISFQIEVGELPPTGHIIPLAEFVPDTSLESVGDWKVEGLGEAQITELGSFLDKEHVLKIDIHDKSCWTGIWYRCPEINVNEYRYLSYSIYFEGGTFAQEGAGQTHCYYWDDGGDAGADRNLPASHAQRKTVSTGEWRTVFMDFRAIDGMQNSDGVEINVKRIQKILINYATSFSWPFPVDNGTVYLADIRLGSEVPGNLVPELTPRCTIDSVPDMTLFPNADEQTVLLSGISAGSGNRSQPNISAKSNKSNFIPDPVVGAVNAQGEASLTFTPKAGTGSAVITVTVEADGSRNNTISFRVDVIEDNINTAVTVELQLDSLYQTIRGFGTFHFPGRQNYIDYYTTDLGASAVRIGIIGNQIEPVNDNNDPYTLDLTAFNDTAFDFNYYRLLREKGVEAFILTSWSPPAWMKRNLSVSYGYASAPNYEDTDNILEPHYYDEFAESMVATVKLFQNNAGITLDALGPQNEPAFTEPYASAVLSPRKFAELIPIIGERFKMENISTKIYMPEQVFSQNHYSMAEYISALRSSAPADEFTSIIATHGYDTDGVGEKQPTYDGWSTLWRQSQRCQYSKEMWMTETFPQYDNWNSALSLAGAIHGALVHGNVGLWTLWSIEGTLMDKGSPTASFYTSKNYYKYIRPGARRVKATADAADILVSSFVHKENRTVTIVLINKSNAPLTVNVSGDSIPASYNTYLTAEHVNFEYRGQSNALHAVIIPGRSVVTLVGDTDGPVADIEEKNNVPEQYKLAQNYPNPFNPTTTIHFSIPIASDVSITVYNILGQQVKTLNDRKMPSGNYKVVWDGTSETGLSVSSGMYFYKMKAGDFIDIKKCLLIR